MSRDHAGTPSPPATEDGAWRRLIAPEQRAELLANGARTAVGQDADPHPVARLFTPDADAVWLLSELDPEDPDRAFGLYDLGLGEPELGYVLLSEIASVRGRFGLPVERDLAFRADRPIGRHADEAKRVGRVAA